LPEHDYQPIRAAEAAAADRRQLPGQLVDQLASNSRTHQAQAQVQAQTPQMSQAQLMQRHSRYQPRLLMLAQAHI